MSSHLCHKPRRWASHLAVIVTFIAICLLAQPGNGQERSAKQVVELFRSMDSHGERLTPEGWLKVAALFVHPDLWPGQQTFGVVNGEGTGQAVISGNRAEVWTECAQLGSIDPMAHFSRVIASEYPINGPGKPINGPLYVRQPYKLVFTDEYWELTHDGRSLKKVKGSTAWRIESFDPGRLVSLKGTIRYLTTLSNTAKDPRIRKNAKTSLASINHLRY